MEKKNCPPSEKEGGFYTKWAFLLIFFYMGFAFAFPSQAQPSSPLIKEINIQGNSSIDEKTIRNVILVKEGDIFSEEKIREDMQKIYDLGYFSSIRVLKQPENGEIILIYEVSEYPVVKNINLLGVSEKEKIKLKKLVTLKPGKPWNYKEARESADKIQKYLQKRGYTQAEVSFSPPSSSEDGQADFYIEKGERARVIEVEILGNTFFEDTKIRSILKTRFKKYFDPEVLEEDIKRIKNLYRREGFYFATISLKNLKFFQDKGIRWVRIFLEVDEGKRFKIERISFEGNSIISDKTLKKFFKPREGEIFNVAKIEESIKTIKGMYGNRGYLYATCNRRFNFNRERGTVNVEILIEEKIKVYVGKIKIEGNNRTKEKVFRNTLLLKEKDVFTTGKLIESWRRIYNLGFFEKVEIIPQETPDPSILNLLVKVKERERTGKLYLGASYTSNLGLEGFIQYAKDNLGGEGKMLSLDWEFGKKRNNYKINYLDRWWQNTKTQVELNLYDTEYKFYDEDKGYIDRRKGGKVSLGFPWKSNFTIFLTAKTETSSIDKMEDRDLPEGIEEEKKSYQSLKPAILWDSRVRDRAFNPYRGLYALFSVEKAGGFLGGDLDFTKYSAELRTYHRLQDIETSPTLAIRMRGRWGENLPAEEEFYIGGQETLRGYEINSFRGREVLLGTAEMRFPFADNLLGYFFVDFGVIKTSTKSEEKTGYGFGIKITTPIGPLRLDYGIGEEGNPRFYFGMIDVF